MNMPKGSGLPESIATRVVRGSVSHQHGALISCQLRWLNFSTSGHLLFFAPERRLSFPYSSPLLSVLKKNVQKVLLMFVSTPISKYFKSESVQISWKLRGKWSSSLEPPLLPIHTQVRRRNIDPILSTRYNSVRWRRIDELNSHRESTHILEHWL